jgi:glycosyltransferase involved in cell wall biosynthesis
MPERPGFSSRISFLKSGENAILDLFFLVRLDMFSLDSFHFGRKISFIMRWRILQIFNRYLEFGGEEAVVQRMTPVLRKVYDVEDFAGSTRDFLGNSLVSKLQAPFRAWYNPSVARQLRRAQRQKAFDFWQVHNVFPGLSPSVYFEAARLGIPVIHFLHNYRLGCVNGLFLNHGNPCHRCLDGNFWPSFFTGCWRDSRLISGWAGLILFSLRKYRLYEKMAGWIALSHHQKSLCVQMGIPESRIHIVPHFHTLKQDPPAPCPEGDVLYLGRLSREKGVDLLLQAWSLVRAHGRKLQICGTGPEEEALRHLARSQGLTNVVFRGFMTGEDLEEVWRQTAFLVVPSIVPETFGMVVLEAWARRRACLSFRLGSLGELIEDNKDGRLVSPGSIEALGSAIQEMVDHPSGVESMGHLGADKLNQNFSEKIWLSRMEKVYQDFAPMGRAGTNVSIEVV